MSGRARWWRGSNLGIVIVLMVALVFILKDVVPRELLDRLAAAIGVNTVAEEASPPATRQLREGFEPLFRIDFSRDSDVLDSDARYALDAAVLTLGRQPDKIVLIADFSRPSPDRLHDEELSKARIAAVELYLRTSGVDADRLHVERRNPPDNPVENGSSYLDVARKLDRIVRITIGGKSSQ